MERDQLTEKEMEKIRLDYTQGKQLICPRCQQNMDSYLENGPLIFGQKPGGPEFEYLRVECPNRHWGRILLGGC